MTTVVEGWQMTDVSPEMRATIQAYVTATGLRMKNGIDPLVGPNEEALAEKIFSAGIHPVVLKKVFSECEANNIDKT